MPAIASEAGALISMIERAARDPSVDIDKMERLFLLQERMSAQRAKAAYLSALADMQPELPVIDKRGERGMYVTFLASSFRTLRFGLNESHAKGMALQVNYLLDHGAVRIGEDGRFSLDLAKTKKAVTGLTHDIMTLQARGDYAGVKALLDKMVVIRPEVQRVLDQLEGVPIDIAPRFVTADALLRTVR